LTAFSTPSSLRRVGSEAPLLLAEASNLGGNGFGFAVAFVLMTKNSLFAKTTFR